jgi:hypothetical protein
MIVPEIDDDKESVNNYVSNYNYHLMCQKSNHHSYYNQMPIQCTSPGIENSAFVT